MEKRFVKTVLSVAAGVAVFLLGLSFGSRPAIAPTITQGALAQHTVNFLLDDGAKITGWQNVALASGGTVLTVLQEVAQQKNLTLDVDTSSSMGAFVKQIGAQKNGTGGKYWQYWVGGAQPMVAADHYQLKGGETILWTFSKSTY